MAEITWLLDINNYQHTVRLMHSIWTGKREIWVDGVVVERGHKLVDRGSRHFVNIQDEEYELTIVTQTAGSGYGYFLLHNNQPILSESDKKKGKTAEVLSKTNFLRDRSFWQELGQLLNLEYMPERNADFGFQHRLVGFLQGYLINIRKIISANSYLIGWSIIVRHSPPFSSSAAETIRSDSRIKLLLGKYKRRKEIFESSAQFSWILLPIMKKETPAEVANHVRSFLAVVTEHVRPLPEGVCENPECSQRQVKDRRLVYINGMPVLYCPDCIAAIPEVGKKAKLDYEKAPDNLLPGLITGLGISLLGGLALVVVAIIIAPAAIAVSYAIPFCVAKAMDKTGTKRSLLRLLVVAIFSIFSITLGNLALNFVELVRLGSPLSVETIVDAFWGMVENPSLLFPSYFIALGMVALLLFSLWYQRKYVLPHEFTPQVEVLPGNY